MVDIIEISGHGRLTTLRRSRMGNLEEIGLFEFLRSLQSWDRSAFKRDKAHQYIRFSARVSALNLLSGESDTSA